MIRLLTGSVGRGRVMASVALSLSLLVVGGCGGGGGGTEGRDRASASGKAVFDGKPIVAGSVTFIHKESGTSATCPISEGEYYSVSGEGPLIGDNAVTVSALDKAEGQPLFGAIKPIDVKVEAAGYTGDFTLTADDVAPASPIVVDEEMQQAIQ